MRRNELYTFLLAFTLLACSCKKKPDTTTTPLHWAAKTGNVQQLNLLLSSGADVNSRDNGSWTPLHWAVHEGHKEAVKLLVSKGADVNAKDKDGWTPLFLTLPEGDEDLIAVLITNGADVNVMCGKSRESPLHFAVRESSRKIIELLIKTVQI